MRLLLAILMTAFLLGGTYLYTAFADSVRRPPVEVQVKLDSAVWRVVVERTFECKPDPDLDIPSLSAEFKGQKLLSRIDSIPSTELIEIKPVTGIEQGDNEIFIEANLAASSDFEFDSSKLSHALRVLVFRGNELIIDQSYWLKRGDYSIAASVIFESPIVEKELDDHDH